ncbi:MAG TPA: hypothetical protein P5305_01225 [Rubrivivax sp.]|nr:hypothetical protein [Rubrivivax sp.]HRY86473.1 hypothetical protein [Rubrivivax sp.]
MPIQISQYETKPAVAINEVHVSEMRIIITEEDIAKAQVRIVYKLFGRDEDGHKHFEPAQKVLQIDDAFVEALVRAGQGDFVLAQALGAIEAAVASLIQQTGEVGTATVVQG